MVCGKCGIEKHEKEFSWKNKSKGIKSSSCKECHRQYSNNHYKQNTKYYKDKARRSRKNTIDRNRNFVFKYLRENPCVDCGNDDIRVLQFDHVRGVKFGSPTGFANNKTLATIKEEIKKCEVRCANCHMIRTGNQLNWPRAQMVER